MNRPASPELLFSPTGYMDFPTPEASPLICKIDEDESPVIRVQPPSESPTTFEIHDDSQTWANLERFYLEHEEKIKKSLDLEARAAGDRGMDIDSALDGVLQTADIVLDGLAVLANIHPVLGVAIFAFNGIVKLDIARRNNNKKVLAVVLQMQNMMSTMFELRNLKRAHLGKARPNEKKNSLQDLCELISKDINKCRSDLAYYSERRTVSKLLRAKGYEQMFGDHILLFTQRRSDLQLVITTYIANGIDNATLAINDVGKQLKDIDRKFEAMIFKIFEKLNTPREKTVSDFIRKHGDKQCVEEKGLLKKLLEESGDTLPEESSGQDSLTTLQNSLREELISDLKTTLEKNQTRFEKLINVQNNNLKRISEQMDEQGYVMYNQSGQLGEILTKVNTVMVYEKGKLTKKTVKLKDPEIQKVWEDMELDRRSVEAKRFVLTFRDHILTGYSMASTPQARFNMQHSDDIPSAASPGGLRVSTSPIQDNQWVLQYIDASHMQPIIEAMDDDGSGFISVQEASKFARSRPKDLSFLQWMAYWAAGWHLNVANYQWNIYGILREMRNILPAIHIANRIYVDEYLADWSFRRVEALLRSIRPLPENAAREPKLCNISIAISNAELIRLDANLKEVSFLLESAPDVMDISGGGNFESWILPLLYLVLKRHLVIMKYGRKNVLHEEEFETHTNSLDSIFCVFDERIKSLESKFCQVHENVEAHFETFAHGMFFTAFKKKEFVAAENTTLYFQQESTFLHHLVTADSSINEEVLDLSVFSKPPGGLKVTSKEDKCDINYTVLDKATHAHPLSGAWTLFRTYASQDKDWSPAPMTLTVDLISEGSMQGRGKNAYTAVSIIGRFMTEDFNNNNNKSADVSLLLIPEEPNPTEHHMTVKLKGQFDPKRNIIEGLWWHHDDIRTSTDNTAGLDENSVTVTPDIEIVSGSASGVQHDTKIQPITMDQETSSDLIMGENQANLLDELEDDPPIMVIKLNSLVNGGTDVSSGLQTEYEGRKTEKIDEDEDTKDEVVAEMYHTGRFTLRRTPADVMRFRPLLDASRPESVPRRRWNFVRAAVLERVRHQLFSTAWFYERFVERQRWIQLAIRYRLADQWNKYRFHASFSEEAFKEYHDLRRSVHPNVGRIYNNIADYYIKRRLYYDFATYCDFCRTSIILVRFQCVTCVQDDMDNQIDLCVDCYTKPVESEHLSIKFSHKPSHSLIRSTRTIHKYDLRYLIANERDWSKRLKMRFQGIEMRRDAINDRKGKQLKGSGNNATVGTSDEPIPTCEYCKKEISLPCYVCCLCVFFICVDCQRHHIALVKESGAYKTHTHMHPLLHIHDSKEVRPTKSDYDRLERQLEEMEVRINEKFTNGLGELEQKIARKLKMKHVGPAGKTRQSPTTNNSDLAIGVTVESFLDSDAALSSGDEDMPVVSPTASEGLTTDGLLIPDRLSSAHYGSSTLAEVSGRVNSLEVKVDELLSVFENKMEERLGALEAKVDTQFGAMISLLQKLVPKEG